MTILLGAIGDDFTGSTDLANTLVRQGMRTVQLIGLPDDKLTDINADAVVVALKSRTIPAAEAVAASLRALAWLRANGCRQFFFKYCSTFDSTDAGNIGPVAKALLTALGSDFTIACPAFPETGRAVFKGHLFVGDVLLSDSGMKDHPLTPMTDANLVRVLGRQVNEKVGLVEYRTVNSGAEAIQTAFERLRQAGVRYAVVDAIEDAHLFAIGEALAHTPLITGGSGIAMGLPENFRRQGLLDPADRRRVPARSKRQRSRHLRELFGCHPGAGIGNAANPARSEARYTTAGGQPRSRDRRRCPMGPAAAGERPGLDLYHRCGRCRKIDPAKK